MTSTYSMLISALVATQDTSLPSLSPSISPRGTSFPPTTESMNYKKLYEKALNELNNLSVELERSNHLNSRRLDEVTPSPKLPIKWLPTCGTALGARYQTDPMYLNGGNDFKCRDFPNLPETCPSYRQQNP